MLIILIGCTEPINIDRIQSCNSNRWPINTYTAHWSHDGYATVGYRVYYSTYPITEENKDSVASLETTEMSQVLDPYHLGLSPCYTMYIRVTAYNYGFESVLSNQVYTIII